MVTLKDIGGYVTERNVWRLLLELSDGGGKYGLETLEAGDILVGNEGFAVKRAGDAFRGHDAVWNVGALAFYALMGVEVPEGVKPGPRTEAVAVPRISSAHAGHEMASLIHQCLDCRRENRPSMDEVNQKAKIALEKETLPARKLVSDSGRSYGESLVSFWPEEMVCILLIFISFLFPGTISAQDNPAVVTDKMNALVKRCMALRLPDYAEKVSNEFDYDIEWTLLDEIEIDRDGECTINDHVEMFGLNDICNRVLKYRDGVVNAGGRFVNGQDPRYKYSLIEVTAKAGAVISYEIRRREGTQTFAVVPYDKDAEFEVRLEQDGRAIADPIVMEGVHYMTASKKMTPEDEFSISISNKSGKNASFVIINHNARD